MLDTTTKRRIDTARDLLVGKVPDPKSQVEQITIALIYKFMDDIDAESEEFGGTRTFFADDFARFGWAKLMHSGLGGHEILNLYAEAITRMPENPGIPPLFRDIFKNAFLPYRDPETLRDFLKIIDEFTYDHSERLGDAFEYLLSVLGSQGDAGQFRTPRHIIDFIVAIIEPKKGDTILDPACGTAGFLISSYKHILKANTDADGHSTLTPDERGRLATNFQGYDISPDMVRLSLVNMYLHGFADPHIFEYDTLTSQDRWNDYADVILANPPFMSPKGGIRPHNRFSVQSKRSEVLFVDYIAEHLTPNGRAGIIVPEGIIFQSQTAYKQLRKLLVEDYLVAVVSLPAGVFQPYSGVKTSILILDKALAKKTDRIAFFKVENDGFDLGAQRRAIDKNDLPQVQKELGEYLGRLRAGESEGDSQPTLTDRVAESGVEYTKNEPTHGLVTEKEKIAAGGEYNLSGERYRESEIRTQTKWPIVELGEIAKDIKTGFACGKGSLETKGVPHLRPMNITEGGQFTWNGLKRIAKEDYFGKEDYSLLPGDVLFNNTNSKELVGKTCLITEYINGGYSNHMTRIRVVNERCEAAFLAHILHSAWRRGEFLERANKWIGQAGINRKSLSEFQIPLPPLEVQWEIVAEIEGYQKVIDGARVVVENYRPQIVIDPEWPVVELGEVCTIVRGSSPRPKGDSRYYGGPIPRLMVADITRDGMYSTPQIDTLTEEGATKSRPMKKGDVIITVSGNPGLPTILAADACIHDGFVGLRDIHENVSREYLYWNLLSQHETNRLQSIGAVFKNLTTHQVKEFKIPFPPLEIQQAIASEIEDEQALVNTNRELIERLEKKIWAVVGRVWGD